MVDVTAWQGPSTVASAALERLQISGTCQGRQGSIPLALRGDYEAALRAAGELGEREPIAASPLLAAASQAHWHSLGSNGCTFAAFLSGQRLEYGWETHVIRGSSEPRELATAVAEIFAKRREEPEVEVVSVLLPEVDDEALLAALLARLGGLSDWEVQVQGEETDAELGPIVRLGVRAAVEFDHWSEVLGFGCFAAQINTRAAPFTEMAIRAKPPKRHRVNQRAYMADIDTGFERDQVREWWRQTEEDRLRRLAPGQNLRGKAKVSFTLLAALWGDM